MSKRGLCIVMLLILLLALGTCTSSTLKPFNLTEKDNGKRVELKTGDELAVILSGNPSTGYGWEIAPVAGSVLEPLGEVEYKAASSELGSPGEFTLRFKAVQTGQQTLRLVYRQPWVENVEPQKVFEATIVVE